MAEYRQAYTQADVDCLRAALARGVLKATINGESVEYASMAEMRKQINIMQADIEGVTRGLRTHYPTTSRGL
ncbi:hypothetical protein SAMN06273572_10242 [Monaibacterium marinum]|uniref:GpW protein n=1 Tax=Pontivivens marinum TaxID=1690039 RepID=A0A2C9CPS9_9RHOB|nr:hypothetical protein [Monaibacterium marinum]SOH93366.1 hypothetical protein SAMN06273572_10242 [Monaibacterium marinum]